MSLKNLSVDDILNEIKIKNAKAENATLTDMQHVDEIISEILTKRQDDQLKRDNRSISLRERKIMDEEIKAQTINLTSEFKKLHKTLDGWEKNESVTKLKSSQTAEIKLAGIKKEQQIKYRNTSEIEIPKELKEKKEQKYQELKKVANNQHILQDMKNISCHFEEAKNENAGVDNNNNTNITTENYMEYKVNRNKKIDEFVIEHKKPEINEEILSKPQAFVKAETPKETTIHNVEQTSKVDNMPKEDVYTEYEYNDKSQNEDVRKNLVVTRKSINITLILLSILSIVSVAFFFTKISQGKILIVGKFPVSTAIYALANMGVLLVAIVSSLSVFTNAMISLSEHKADKDLLYTIMITTCFLENVAISLNPNKLLLAGITLYTPIIVMLLFVNFLSKSLSIKKIIKNFEFISNDEEKYALTQVDDRKAASDMTKGVVEGEPLLAKNIKVDFFENFLANSFKPDISDIIANKIAMFAVPIALVLGAIGYLVTKELYVSATLASGTMLMLTGFIGSIIVAFPLFDTAEVVNHFSGMMPEYSAINTYKNTDAILVDANDLFPQNAVTLQGIKTFQGKRIDDAIIDAASVVCSANSVLKGVFLSIINHKTELLKPVDSIIYEDLMGLSAWVNEKRVLIGNRELMINHSIAVPKAEYETKYRQDGNEVIFLSSGGELCAAFIIQFQADSASSEITNLLYKNDIVAVIKTVDSCITGELLERVFQVDGGLFKILPSRLHKTFDFEMQPKDKVDSLLGNNGSLFGNIVSIVACKKLASCTKLGSVMYIFSAICGVLFLAVMTFLKNFAVIGNLQLFIYMATFGVVYWVYEKNMKL